MIRKRIRILCVAYVVVLMITTISPEIFGSTEEIEKQALCESLPDLVIIPVNIAFYPEEPIEDFTDNITVSILVWNNGSEDAVNVDVYMWMNDTLGAVMDFKSIVIVNIPSNSTKIVTFVVADIPVNYDNTKYNITIALDPNDTVLESNEDNNEAIREITVHYMDEEAQDGYRELDIWLDEKLVEWRPAEYKPMHFMGFHCSLSNGFWDYTSLDDDLAFLDMLEEAGVDIISIGVYGAPEDLPQNILDRYDTIFNEVRNKNLKLKIWIRTFMYGTAQKPQKALSSTQYVMEHWDPEYLVITHEPKCDSIVAMQYLKNWVEDCCQLAKSINPNVTTSVTVLNYYGRLDCIDYFVQIDELDIIGFDIYGLWGLCPECEGGNAIADAIDDIHAAGKDAWIEELWLSIEWDRRTSDPIDMVPGFNDPHRAWWDSRFTRVMTYYAQNHGLLGIEHWFSPYFVLYPGYDTIWELDGEERVFKDKYVEDFMDALVEQRRTPTFYGLRDVIKEVFNNTIVLDVDIIKPLEDYLYIFGRRIAPLEDTIIIGKITVEANVFSEYGVEKIEFYIDDVLKNTDMQAPFEWPWNEKAIGRHEMKVVAYDEKGNTECDKINVIIFNI